MAEPPKNSELPAGLFQEKFRVLNLSIKNGGAT